MAVNNDQTAFVLSPHRDDAELGCGATIHMLVSKGWEVFNFIFVGECTDDQMQEAAEAEAVLGIKSRFFDYPDTALQSRRQEILDRMIWWRNAYHPSFVLLPSPSDVHQDHHTIYREGSRAFKYTTMLAYELPWNARSERLNCFINLSEKDIDAKLSALECHRSQAHKHYMDAEFIRGLARVRGVQANTQYAEAFEVLRWMM